MKRWISIGLMGLLALAGAAQAQDVVRLRGSITAYDGKTLAVHTREGANVNVELSDKLTVAYMKALRLEDVKPGTALGTSAVMGRDGKLIARELHLFSAERGIPNEGTRPWDLEPGSSMTNATVSAVAQASGGREITLTYKGGSQQVIVPAGIPVVTAVEGDRSLLKPGEYVLVAATRGADGRIVATRIQVSKDGVRPPQ
jgi:hypothetical protein